LKGLSAPWHNECVIQAREGRLRFFSTPTIGDNITITVLRTKGKAVRLGIEAPSDVPVIRGELSFEISEDEAEAAVDSTPAEPTMAKRAVRRPNPSWSAESPAQSSQVQLKRVPRGEVSEYLPKLVTGSAPLRAMMEQR